MKFINTTTCLLLISIALPIHAKCNNPKAITIKFWNAVNSKDFDTMKQILANADLKQIEANDMKARKSFMNEGHLQFEDFSIGKITNNDYEARVETMFTGIIIPDTDKTISTTFNTVLIKENSKWKVKLTDTVINMISALAGSNNKDSNK